MQTDFKPFLLEALEARERFVGFINSQEWNTKLRTEAEDIIIFYDQLVDRYNKASRGEPIESDPEPTPIFVVESNKPDGCLYFAIAFILIIIILLK